MASAADAVEAVVPAPGNAAVERGTVADPVSLVSIRERAFLAPPFGRPERHGGRAPIRC